MTTDMPAPAVPTIRALRFKMPIPTEERRDTMHVVPVVVRAPQEIIDEYMAADDAGKLEILGDVPQTGAGILFIPDEALAPGVSETFASDLVDTLVHLAEQGIVNRDERGIHVLPLSDEEIALVEAHRANPTVVAEVPTVDPVVIAPSRPGRVVTPGFGG